MSDDENDDKVTESTRDTRDKTSAMHPTGGEPFGAVKLPREQPRPDPSNLAQREALQAGASSPWLVPAGVLGLILIALFGIAYTLQPIIPTIGIVFVIMLWLTMLLASRRSGPMKSRSRLLAWLMGAMAAGAAVLFCILYAWEASL
jgi:ABC-type multidrug transport system fused ATPase/permease subunit